MKNYLTDAHVDVLADLKVSLLGLGWLACMHGMHGHRYVLVCGLLAPFQGRHGPPVTSISSAQCPTKGHQAQAAPTSSTVLQGATANRRVFGKIELQNAKKQIDAKQKAALCRCQPHDASPCCVGQHMGWTLSPDGTTSLMHPDACQPELHHSCLPSVRDAVG